MTPAPKDLPRLAPTGEQQAILDAVASGGTVAISAAAGSGKTSTLRMIADAGGHRRMLYVAYNKAIQVEAERSFPANVTCKTAHALAYRAFGAPMRTRLSAPRMTGTQTAKVLGIAAGFGFSADLVFTPAAQAAMAMGMVTRFCHTASLTIETWHLHAPEGLNDDQAKALAARLLPYARHAWDDLTAGPAGRLRPTHDVYLKQWQLSSPELTGWDVILYDENQDADPCVADVIEHQTHAQLVAVGDSAQAIYGWRGAGDFLSRVPAQHRLMLTQSWRFGPAVADEANVWLGVVGTDLRVRGNPGRDSTLGPVEAPDAILCRTNAGTIDALMDAHQRDRKVHLVGDGKEMLSLAYAAARLQDGKPAGHPELVAFRSWEQLVEYAEHDPAGSDLAVAVRMIDRYGTAGVIGAVEGTVPAAKAELVVSTAHKAKGLEWDRVRIGGRYREPLDTHTGQPLPIRVPDAMLAYVSVTRARADAVLMLLDHSFEMFLKAAILHRGGRIREPGEKNTIGFDACVRRCFSDARIRFLTEEQALTLQAINGLRDAAQHHLVDLSEGHLYLHAQSGITLFRDLFHSVFGEQLADSLPARTLPISTVAQLDPIALFVSEVEEVKRLCNPAAVDPPRPPLAFALWRSSTGPSAVKAPARRPRSSQAWPSHQDRRAVRNAVHRDLSRRVHYRGQWTAANAPPFQERRHSCPVGSRGHSRGSRRWRQTGQRA